MNHRTYASSNAMNGLSRRLLLLSSALGVLTMSSMLHAQPSYPSRSVRLVVPLPAGTSPDVIARMWGERFTKLTGQPVTVENKLGAASIIAAQAVAAAAPDGYTLLWSVNNTFSINPFLYKKLPYSIESFVPVSHVVGLPLALVVSAESKVRSLDDLIKAARAAPGKLTYASPGIGTSPHLMMERLLHATGVSMTHVPYKDYFGTDLVAQRIDVGFDGVGSALAQLKAGKMRVLGVSSATRVDLIKDVAPIAETLPGFNAESWVGVFAPKGTHEDVVALINKHSSSIISDPEFQQKVIALGSRPIGGSTASFREFLVKDADGWSQIIRKNNITLD